jgi:hypothetical protein
MRGRAVRLVGTRAVHMQRALMRGAQAVWGLATTTSTLGSLQQQLTSSHTSLSPETAVCIKLLTVDQIAVNELNAALNAPRR